MLQVGLGPHAQGCRRLDELTMRDYAAILGQDRPLAVLQPVGSVEPHGPHLPLGTDTMISVAAAERAARRLDEAGVGVLVAPAIPFGVTDFASGFPGAVSVPADALTAFLRAIVVAHQSAGALHVCLINNHLEPAQDAAVRAAISDLAPGSASVACPLTRRWARTLSAEFKSGACHAGRYESSLVLAARPELVSEEARASLAEVPISLSDGIRDGKSTFQEMGMNDAYAGAPAAATADEGEEQLDLLATMIVTEVTEGLAKRESA
ncbi:MAG: creatininase family protein [Polyangiaceae bacterium]|nr:creatininase family protein [Polyangiaceae bacterium]